MTSGMLWKLLMIIGTVPIGGNDNMAIHQFECHRKFTNNVTGQIHERFWDALPHKLTVNPDYIFPTFDTGTYETLFREVSVTKPMDALSEEERDIMTCSDEKWAWKRKKLRNYIADSVKRAIALNWKPGKFHLVYHSSGYDSRIMSGTILQLRRERGKDWLGDVLFACLGPEGNGFKRIMGHEGWNDNQYTALSYLPPHFDRCIDFVKAPTWLNGPINTGYELNWLLMTRLQEMGQVPNDNDKVQVMSGRNGVANGCWHGWDWTVERDYCEQNYNAPTSAIMYRTNDVLYPMQDYDIIRALVMCPARIGWEFIREDVLDYIDSDLYKLPRVDMKIVGYPYMTSEQYAKVHADYDKSWYAKSVCPSERAGTTDAINTYHDWWSRWTCAVIVEHLIKNGYDINA